MKKKYSQDTKEFQQAEREEEYMLNTKEKIVAIMKKHEIPTSEYSDGMKAVYCDNYKAVATEITVLFKHHIALTRDQLKDLEILTAGTSDENFQRLNQVFSDALGEKKQSHKY